MIYMRYGVISSIMVSFILSREKTFTNYLKIDFSFRKLTNYLKIDFSFRKLTNYLKIDFF